MKVIRVLFFLLGGVLVFVLEWFGAKIDNEIGSLLEWKKCGPKG